jgi:hypothetical protein
LIKQFFCSENNVNRIGEVLNSLYAQIEIRVDIIIYGPSAKVYFPVEFQIMPNIFFFLVGSSIEKISIRIEHERSCYFVAENVWNWWEAYTVNAHSDMSYAVHGYVNSSSCVSILPLYYLHRHVKCPLGLSWRFQITVGTIFLNWYMDIFNVYVLKGKNSSKSS